MTPARGKKNNQVTIKPTHAVLGAEIAGVDLSRGLDRETFLKIENAYNKYSVIFFRDQNLAPEQQISFTRWFGNLEVNPNTQYALSGYPEVLLVSNVERDGKLIGLADAGRFWHTDMSYTERPPRCSILYAKEIPLENGEPLGDTLFVSVAAAYDALSEDVKKRIEGLKAIHSFRSKKRVPDSKRDAATLKLQREYPDVIHPVVRTHPATKRKCVYVSADECIGIVGMSDDEAMDLINELAEHCIQEKFMYRHRWRVGDVLMWDNCAVQHRAIADYQLPLRRLMHRTTVDGTRPV